MPIENTEMTKNSFNYIRDRQQFEKYEALNTYKVKLLTTQAVNYTASNESTEVAHGVDLTNEIGDQNNFSPYWYLPAIEGNHIQNCLMRIKQVHISSATYSFQGVIAEPDDTGAETAGTNYLHNDCFEPCLFIECDSVLDKTFISNSHKAVMRKNILGSINFSSLIKVVEDHTEKTGFIANHPIIDTSNMTDSDWILCANPFGNKISLKLIKPTDLSAPIIKSSKDGLEGAHTDGAGTKDNSILNAPICYELEIKLLPDNQSNDKFSY